MDKPSQNASVRSGVDSGIHQSKPSVPLYTAFAILLLIGLIGYMARKDAVPTYTSTAAIQLANSATASTIDSSDPRKSLSITRAVAPGGVLPSDRISFISVDAAQNTFTVAATAEGKERSEEMAEAAAELVVRQDMRTSLLNVRRKATHPQISVSTGIAEVTRRATYDNTELSVDSPSTPFAYSLEIGGFVVAGLIGGVGLLVGLFSLVVQRLPKPAQTDRPTATVRPAFVDAAQSADVIPEIKMPPLRTLVTISSPKDLSAAPNTKPNSSSAAKSSDSTNDTPLYVDIDEVFIQRLEQYKAHSPDAGCVLLVTQGYPPKAVMPSARLLPGIAPSIIEIAEQLVESHNISVMIVDAGSSGWSKRGAESVPSSEALQLPAVPGLYDILKGKATLDDSILCDDEAPAFGAVASGEVPKNWPELLRSTAMQELMESSRTHSDLVIVYGPPCLDRAETVRVMSQWTNGVMIAGLDDQNAEAAAVELLYKMEVKIFGRIALSDS